MGWFLPITRSMRKILLACLTSIFLLRLDIFNIMIIICMASTGSHWAWALAIRREEYVLQARAHRSCHLEVKEENYFDFDLREVIFAMKGLSFVHISAMLLIRACQ